MKGARTVYSTEQGRICPECGKGASRCTCGTKIPGKPGGGQVRVGRETSGRKGRGVTVITGLPLDEDGLKSLARELKKLCGSGGTVKDAVIEIQGDHRDLMVDELVKRGYPAKRSGG